MIPDEFYDTFERQLPDMHVETRGRCRALGLCSTWCRYRLHEGPDRCALDVAGRGGLTLDGVAACFGVTRERIRQIEAGAARRFRRRAVELGLDAAMLDGFEVGEGIDLEDAPPDGGSSIRRGLERFEARKVASASSAKAP